MGDDLSAGWQKRVDEAWGSFDERNDDDNVALFDELANELPAGSPVGWFERASVQDATGHEDLAVPLYRRALELGLGGDRRRPAVIQLASSLRNLGRADESVAMLIDEAAADSDDLDDAVRAFLALSLVDLGREREAVSLALGALASHLPRYRRSVARYARQLVTPDDPA
jgi:tetratricopeptide (TPR) repeat protein